MRGSKAKSGKTKRETRLAAHPIASKAPAPTASTAACPLSSKVIPVFRHALLRWYGRHRRDLPWRKTCDPYRIWLSEIMLQQTRVAAVLDHYRLFLERFPDVETLAAASEEAVLAAWSGLGYYRRARMLRQCAREIVLEHDGRFPENAKALRALPGIGRYTAAAIASITFGQSAAVVDGNVERVLQRFLGRELEQEQNWACAQELMSKARPGDFNQAMMELGATVCLPREPHCTSCPVRQWCRAQGEIPLARTSVRQTQKQIWCALERRDHHVRLVQRPKAASLMAGMWELPQWGDDPRVSVDATPWRTFRHSITVTNYTVHVLRRPGRNGIPGARGRWIEIDKIQHLPITGLTRKILKADGVI